MQIADNALFLEMTGSGIGAIVKETAELNMYLLAFWKIRENLWYQYKNGVLDENIWLSYQVPMVRGLKNGGLRRVFWDRIAASDLNPEFVIEMNALFDKEQP